MDAKGCSKRNRWHFRENIGNAWNRVRRALRCLDITCFYILSFLLKDFWQTEQSQLMSTPQEQNVEWERGRMLRIYIGFQAIKSHCFLAAPPLSPPPPPPPHCYCFRPTTTTPTTFLLFSLHHHHHHISIVFRPPPPPSHFHCFPLTTTTISFSLFFVHEIL